MAKAPASGKLQLFGGTSAGLILEEETAILLAADRQLVNNMIGVRVKDDTRDYVDVQYVKDPREPCKMFVFKERFGCAGVGLRNGPEGVGKWLQVLLEKANDNCTVEECRQYLEDYRVRVFDKKGDKETVEILFAGWDTDTKPKPHLYAFHNAGCAPVDLGTCIGKGRGTGLMTLNDPRMKNLCEKDAVELLRRVIFDAYLSDDTTGVGVDVLVIRPNSKPYSAGYMTMAELEAEFGTETTGMEVFLKRIEERSKNRDSENKGSTSTSSH